MQSHMHMRCQARQLDSYSTARHCSTARQLDRTRQTSTPRRMQSASTGLDGLDSYSTATRQLLDRLDRQGLDSTSTAASTAARRSLDTSTARQLDSQGSRLHGARADSRQPGRDGPVCERPASGGTSWRTRTAMCHRSAETADRDPPRRDSAVSF